VHDRAPHLAHQGLRGHGSRQREILGDGDNALLVPPGDVEALAGAINRLLAETELALRLARSAFAQAPRYSWDSRAQQLRQLVEELP